MIWLFWGSGKSISLPKFSTTCPGKRKIATISWSSNCCYGFITYPMRLCLPKTKKIELQFYVRLSEIWCGTVPVLRITALQLFKNSGHQAARFDVSEYAYDSRTSDTARSRVWVAYRDRLFDVSDLLSPNTSSVLMQTIHRYRHYSVDPENCTGHERRNKRRWWDSTPVQHRIDGPRKADRLSPGQRGRSWYICKEETTRCYRTLPPVFMKSRTPWRALNKNVAYERKTARLQGNVLLMTYTCTWPHVAIRVLH